MSDPLSPAGYPGMSGWKYFWKVRISLNLLFLIRETPPKAEVFPASKCLISDISVFPAGDGDHS